MEKKLSIRQIIIIASTLFGMIFGAGNLIFPVHLGQLAGSNYIPGTLGFLITGVGIPILGVIAIGASESNGLFSLSNKVSKKFAYAFTTILYFAIGPCFVMPRSSSISFNAGLPDIIGSSINIDIAYLIFSIVFFAIVCFFSLRPSGITTWIGRIINPIFLVSLFFLIIVALVSPMGDISQVEPIDSYKDYPVFCGFIEGYGTMDALAGLAFGIIVINIVKDMGIKSPSGITKNITIPSLITGALMCLIYTLCIVMGGQSCGVFEASSNGSIALGQISNYYFGFWGSTILTVIITLGSIKTSIGLATSCSTTFCEMFPNRLSYKRWVAICIAISFAISNIGLDNIIEITQPVLSLLCPLAIVLIILAFCGSKFGHSSIIYKWTIWFTAIAAFFDFLAKMPTWIVDSLNIHNLCNIGYEIFPFMDIGFGWLIPAIAGFVIGIICYKIKNKSKKVNKTS